MDRNKVIEAAARLIATGAYDEAIKEYQRLLDVDPKDVRVLQKMGELFQKRSDIAEAARYFTKGAESHASDGFWLKAVALYKQVLKLDPSRIDVSLKLAELHEQLQLMPEAMAYFQAAADHYAKAGNTEASLDALTRLGTVKRTVDRERIASRISEPERQKVARARELAEVCLSKGDPMRALAALKVCFEADSRNVDTLRLLAQAFQGLGESSKAVSIYKELARVHQEQGRRGEAEQVWRKVEQLAPHDADAAQRRLASGLVTAAPPHAAPPRAAPAPQPAAEPVLEGDDAAATVSQALQLRINLVSGVKASKANAFRSVAPQPWREVTAGSLNAPVPRENLGALLTGQGLINASQLKRASEAQQPGEHLQSALIRTGAIQEGALIEFLSKQYGVPAINVDDFDIDSEVRALIPQHLWVTLCLIPINVAGPSLIVAMRDPSDLAAIDDLRFLTGRSIEPVLSSELSIRRTIDRYCRAPRAFLN